MRTVGKLTRRAVDSRWVIPAALIVFVLALISTVSSVQALGPNAIRSGFDTNTLAANDDGSTGAISLGFTANFFGTNQTAVFVNNNGNLTFGSALSAYSGLDLGNTTKAIIAPFFGDVDTRELGSAVVTYGTGTVDGRLAFGANWPGVRCFFSATTELNHFQVLLIDRSDVAAGDFDIEFNYDQILWGSSGGGSSTCIGGSNPIRAGYANGSGTFSEIAGSVVADAFVDGNSSTGLVNNSLNSSQLGRYVFAVRGGTPASAVASVPVPSVSTWGLLIMGGAFALLLVAMVRRQRRALKPRA